MNEEAFAFSARKIERVPACPGRGGGDNTWMPEWQARPRDHSGHKDISPGNLCHVSPSRRHLALKMHSYSSTTSKNLCRRNLRNHRPVWGREGGLMDINRF